MSHHRMIQASAAPTQPTALAHSNPGSHPKTLALTAQAAELEALRAARDDALRAARDNAERLRGRDGGDGADEDDVVTALVHIQSCHLRLLLQLAKVLSTTPNQPAHLLRLDGHTLNDELE